MIYTVYLRGLKQAIVTGVVINRGCLCCKGWMPIVWTAYHILSSRTDMGNFTNMYIYVYMYMYMYIYIYISLYIYIYIYHYISLSPRPPHFYLLCNPEMYSEGHIQCCKVK